MLKLVGLFYSVSPLWNTQNVKGTDSEPLIPNMEILFQPVASLDAEQEGAGGSIWSRVMSTHTTQKRQSSLYF